MEILAEAENKTNTNQVVTLAVGAAVEASVMMVNQSNSNYIYDISYIICVI